MARATQLCETWMQRAIDFSALRHALSANPTLPQATLRGMLDTLPAAGDLLTEQTVSETTREAIVSVVDARDRNHTDRLAFFSGGFAVAACAILAGDRTLRLDAIARLCAAPCARRRTFLVTSPPLCEDGRLIDGDLRKRELELVQAWIEIHHDELHADWELAVAAEEPFRIAPLQ